jgi:Flp pilus assembly protein TadD/Tfp pilus assembly protein PilF
MENHRRSLGPIFAALCLLLAASPGRADETPLGREAGDHLLHGNVKAALALFEQTATERQATLDTTQWPAGDAAILAQALARQGRYAEARRVLAQPLNVKNPETVVILAQAELERQAGTLPARVALLGKAVKSSPGDPQLLVALGSALYESGKGREARKLLDPLADRYENGQFKEPLDLLAVAESLRLNGYVRDANRVYEEASRLVENDRERLALELAWGKLFVSKYNYRDGDRSLKKVLSIDPKQPAALVAMARVDLKSDQDVARARKRLDALLADNPRELDGLLLRAEVALHDEDYPAAKGFLARAQEQRADNLDTLAVRAALAKLSDQPAEFTAVEKAAKKINPDDGRLWLVTGEYLEMAHRYGETLRLLQTAIQTQPELWQAHGALGMSYARVADDVKAQKELETAYGGDPFDVRTGNQLNVLYDGVLKQMVTLPGKKADLRVHRQDRKAFEREMLPFLQEAMTALEAKYAFVAEKPIQVEIFPETEQFSVRTVGLPALGAHAVCFGHLVTSRSPSEKPFNWKMVLWHELSHIYHIQMTDGRVPRWLTEGLAMMESAWANPRWAMRMDRRAYDRLNAGQLAHVANFNLAFSQAQSMQEIIDAYYQSMLLTQYLSDTYGFAKLRNLVAGHKTGATTVELVQREFAVTPEALDVAFAAWLGQKLARFDKDFRPYLPALAKELATADKPVVPAPTEAEEDAEAAEAPADVTPPSDAERPLRPFLTQAVAALSQGNLRRGAQMLAAGLAEVPKLDPQREVPQKDICTLRALQMDVLVSSGNRVGAALEAEALVKVPNGQCDGVRQRAVLAMIAAKPGTDPLEMVTHLTVASQLDPSDPSVAALWLEVAEKAHGALVQGGDAAKKPWVVAIGSRADARRKIRVALELDPNEPKYPALLAKLAWQDWQGGELTALDDLQLAATALAETDPAGRLAVLFEARRLQAEGQLVPAILPYRLAAERATASKDRAEAWCELAEMAAKTASKDDAGEAKRRCAAEQTAPQP